VSQPRAIAKLIDTAAKGAKLPVASAGRIHSCNMAAIQELVKGALEVTVRLHTNKATRVYHEIDGEIVEEWDA
jgi:hypothetical protein